MKRFIAVWAGMMMWTATGCVADVETEEDGAEISMMSDAPGDDIDPVDEGVEQPLVSLPECQRGCRNGQQAMEQFCAGVPDPRVRATCWGAAKAGLAACLGWCYLHYGD